MANFKGFKQETLTNYNALTKEEKLNYLWLVRDVDRSGETEVVKSSAIYFGSRKYAEVNGSDEELVNKINAITFALGMVAGQDGAFKTYLPIGGDPILSGETITNVSEALKALSKAIVAAEATANEANTAAGEAKTAADTASKDVATLTEKVGTEATVEAPATGIYAKIDAVEKKLDPNQEGSIAKDVETAKADISTIKGQIGNETSGILGDIAGLKTGSATKAEVNAIDEKFKNYYTQTQINEKLTALLRWKGNKSTLEEIKAVEGAVVGDVWHCVADGAEYVFVGGEVEDKKWEYLGVSVSLDGYVTETTLTTKLADYATTATTGAIDEKVGKIEGRVTGLEAKSTRTVTDYSEITGLTGCSAGQFVYATNSYTKPEDSGSTFAAGAYLITSVDTTGKPLTIAKIESTSQTEAAPVERIAALEAQVNSINAQIGEKGKDGKDGTGILGDVEKLQNSHSITGDDVE